MSTQENMTRPVIRGETLSGLQVKGIQHAMKLSDEQLAEALGLSASNGTTRIRKWKSGKEEPSGPAAKLLLLLYRVDGALRQIDSGEWDRGHETLRRAVPDFLQ